MSCLKRDKATLIHRNMISLFIVFELDTWSRDLSSKFILGGCLVQAMKLTENFDRDKYGYTCYGIGFDAHSQFSLPTGEWGKNVVIFDISIQTDNRKKIS